MKFFVKMEIEIGGEDGREAFLAPSHLMDISLDITLFMFST